MKQTRLIMGMPISVEVVGEGVEQASLQEVFSYFAHIDQKFSTYKKDSEIEKINRGELKKKDWSADMKKIFKLAEKTKKETAGYFDISHNGRYDPSGIVKGWAILNAAKILKNKGYKNFYIDAGGDIEIQGQRSKIKNQKWKVGIKNPFNQEEIVKVLEVEDCGVATSGTYIRGNHIYNPKTGEDASSDVASMTVIGPDIYEADRLATAAFAMGKKGIEFLEGLKGFEGYMIDSKGIATMTSGFGEYEAN